MPRNKTRDTSVCIENHVDIKITAGGVWGKKKAPRRALFLRDWANRVQDEVLSAELMGKFL